MIFVNNLTPLFVLIWIICWIATFIIGTSKGTGCASAIVGVLGPIGLIAVLVDKGNRVKCPFCQEFIDKKAVKCPRCQSHLRQQQKSREYCTALQLDSQRATGNNKFNKGDDLAAQQIRAFGMINLDKFTDLPQDTLQSVITSVKIEVMDGIPRRKTLAHLLSENPTLKDLIIMYANTLKGDFLQMMEDISSESYTDGFYWVYQGPNDSLTRSACRDLLAIKYFTNWQRKEAERLTFEDRKFDCRHTFIQISDSTYHEAIKNRVIDIQSVHNQSLVKALLED